MFNDSLTQTVWQILSGSETIPSHFNPDFIFSFLLFSTTTFIFFNSFDIPFHFIKVFFYLSLKFLISGYSTDPEVIK